MDRRVLVAMAGWLASGVAYAQAPCTDIRSLVCSLAPGFVAAVDPADPVPNPAYRSPNCENSDQAKPEEKDAVQAAFSLIVNKAPLFLAQDELCKLDHIFIIRDASLHSWGKWENPTFHSNPDSNHTYIALHQGQIGKTTAAVQDGHLDSLGINVNANKHSSTNDSAPIGLLYLMAHELGHIKWHKEWSGGGIACFNNGFVPASWADTSPADKSNLATAKSRRWTEFGNSLGAHRKAVPFPRGATSASLRKIYDIGFITALAAANPEEDFVETYAVRTVMKAASNLDLSIRIGHDADRKVNGRQANPDLKAKFDCVDLSIGGPPVPVLLPSRKGDIKRRH